MKKLIINEPGGFENCNIVEQPAPTPKADEVVVRWHATSLNFHDYLVARGLIKVMDGRVPMSDGAGEVVAAGSDVRKWNVGDKVMSMFFPNWIEGKPTMQKTIGISGESMDGFMAEQSCVAASALTAMPEGMSYAAAATLPTAGLTAWRALMFEGNLQAGQKILIEGTGGVSIVALQMAKAIGAEVFATTSSNQKAERLKAMGATAVVNYREDERWGKTIFKMTDGGVDHVIDVGGGSTMKQSIEAAAIGGHIISIGILGDGRKGEITFPKLFFKHLTMTGIAVGSREMQEAMVNAININQLQPVLDKSFAFDQLVDAFKYQESGKHFGKIVLEW